MDAPRPDGHPAVSPGKFAVCIGLAAVRNLHAAIGLAGTAIKMAGTAVCQEGAADLKSFMPE
jgi:hypothetical protein